MSTPGRSAAAKRLIVVSHNGRCRRFDLDGDGRLSFAHIARVFRIPITAPDDCDTWTLDDTSLRIDKSDSGALLTASALRDLFPLPSGTAEQPLVLRTDDADGHSPYQQLRRQSRGGGETPAKSPAAASAAAAAARINLASPTTRSTAAAAAAAAAATAPACDSPRRSSAVTPRAPRAAAVLAPAGGYQTPGAVSPLRGARTPLGPGLALAATRLSPQQAPSARGARRPLQLQLDLAAPLPPDSELLKHPKGQGTFFFSPAAAQHLPMLMACHLPPPLQRLLRSFSAAAQCVITARAMTLYAVTCEAEYFRDQRLEAALTEARSHNPPQDRFCAYTQSVRLTGRKRKPAASPLPARDATTPQTTRGSGPASTDVDMDAGGWAFAGGGTLHCPGGIACKKSGRHENWLLSDAANHQITYLPVLYDSEDHSAVLLPLTDESRVGHMAAAAEGGAGGATRAAPSLVWFRFEYESRGGRRGHSFWDRGLCEHLERAVRDVAGEEALQLARGA